MIAEVLESEADMAVADLSITTERLNAVEFSMPWMNLGEYIALFIYNVLTVTLLSPRYFNYLHEAPEGPAKPSVIPGAV